MFDVAINCLKNYKKELIVRRDFIEKEIASGSTSSYKNELVELKRQIEEFEKAILVLQIESSSHKNIKDSRYI